MCPERLAGCCQTVSADINTGAVSLRNSHVITFLNTPSSPVRISRVVVGVHRRRDDRVVKGLPGQGSGPAKSRRLIAQEYSLE
jgi:hypothetical protein